MRYLVNNQPADEFTAKRHFQQWYLRMHPQEAGTVQSVLRDWDVAVQLFTMATSGELASKAVLHYSREMLRLSGVEIVENATTSSPAVATAV